MASAERLARQLLKLHAAKYDNEKADARNVAFEQLALELARAVLEGSRER